MTGYAYRVSQADNEIIQRQVKEMLDNGVISPSKSDYRSPVVLARKVTNPTEPSTAEPRFCADYRRPNGITLNSNKPSLVIKAVLCLSAGSISICQKPEAKSKAV